LLPVWVVIGLALVLGIVSVASARARAVFLRQRLGDRAADGECPPATVIVPVKGKDEFLAANLASLAALDYPDFELIVVAREARDLPEGVVPPGARVVIAGEGDAMTGEKITNLLAAVDAARTESAVLAFADSDSEVKAGWLRSLVAALRGPAVGAATGFRFHLPDSGRFWALLRSVWNSVALGSFGSGDNAFCWGGAMAIRRDLFEQARVREYWRGAVSDDYQMSRAVHDAGWKIAFAPGALVADRSDTGGREFLGWIARQMILTRVHQPRLWCVGLAAHVIYCAAMVAAASVEPLLLLTQIALGMAGGAFRLGAARAAFPEYGAWFARHGSVHALWTPVATWVWLYSFLASARTNTIHWRGVRYGLAGGGRVTKVERERTGGAG